MKPKSLAGMLCLCLLWTGLGGAGELWNWSERAVHHQAVCLVRASSAAFSSSGSGCYVRIGRTTGVLTARHCLDGNVTIRWSDGSITAAEYTTDRSGADLGFVLATHATIAPLDVSAASPQSGQWLEFSGFGGPADRLRHWWGRLQPGAGRDESGNPFSDYDSPVMQGDSGGPVLNEFHQVVGVITVGGGNPIASLGAARAFGSTGGPAYPVVYDFVTRVDQRYGGLFIGGVRGNCGPNSCGPASGGFGWAYPPQPIPQPAPQPIPQPAPQPIPQPAPQPIPQPAPQPGYPTPELQLTIDYDRLARVLCDYFAADVRFRGPVGPPGEQGNRGPPALVTTEQLQQIACAVYAQMLGDPRFRGPAGSADEISQAQLESLLDRLAADPRFRGPAGNEGPPGPVGSAGTSPAIDLDKLAKELVTKLPPIYFRKVNSATGAEIAPPEPVRLGEGFTFVLTPAK